ncbi:16S rRNA (guanine(527)-N(7))-methyltransferase RsmG [Mycoplasmopsis caviae]|uniref:Ribosomal RNA small subunit methyltransferase G n=1 Tax=Mycoplasmopsis caviae TaxID=55603 RepID=A0A3P8MDH6_9BACT|nr:16S rRNA (guanine(527)-N(7))-methyltransferase RsmG [Mycoplasmopsis caviae]UUD35383.1 16S rRNA (guanine(527)-N(7))-methyltransferase RsmG [Mycoplasmopsis caviae]VDR41840.1 glucose-inhibited division protein B [Mycoplasmopsis caviae]
MAYREITKKDLLKKYDLKIKELKEYAQMIYDQNKVMNITGFKTLKDIYEQGILDSILAFENYVMQFDDRLEGKKILDIGSGAGFPSIPLLIALDNSFELTIIEAQEKRCDFLNKVKERFNLNVNIINNRVESVLNYKNYFDIITARAFASIKVICLSSMHLLKDNRKFVLLKGENFKQELLDLYSVNELTSLSFEAAEYDNLAGGLSYVVVFDKIKVPKTWPLPWVKISKM